MLSLIVALSLVITAAQTAAVAPADGVANQVPGAIRVKKHYGAAVRTAPSSDAAFLFHTLCGDVWPVIDTQGDWYRVFVGDTVRGEPWYGDREGWVGAGRVESAEVPPSSDCGDPPGFYVSYEAETFVETGCLSLRAAPSRRAAIRTCVANGHRYGIVDGPFDPGTGEDWFEVWSPSTEGGWVLADHLRPIILCQPGATIPECRP